MILDHRTVESWSSETASLLCCQYSKPARFHATKGKYHIIHLSCVCVCVHTRACMYQCVHASMHMCACFLLVVSVKRASVLSMCTSLQVCMSIRNYHWSYLAASEILWPWDLWGCFKHSHREGRRDSERERKRQTETESWCFTPSQPVWSYQGKTHFVGGGEWGGLKESQKASTCWCKVLRKGYMWIT